MNTATSPPTTLGTTCMPFTVGAPGDGLNLATLPSGSGSGGPADPRGVALNAQLGLDSTRSSQVVDWSALLPTCNANAPTAATCGSSAMNFASTSTDPYKAAYLAVQDHVNYWMQISGGDAVSTALVNERLLAGGHRRPGGALRHRPAGLRRLRTGDHVGAVERVQQHRVEQRRHLCHVGAQALLPGGQVRGARHQLDRHRRFDPRARSVVVAAAHRRRRTGLDGRGRHAPLHRLQRCVRRGRHAGPGPSAPGAPGRQAAVVHRDRAGGATATTTSSARPTAWPGR